MGQVVLVSKNDIINSLYELNLRAYVAVNVTVKSKLSDAAKLIEHSPNIDAIIIFKENNRSKDELEEFKKFITDNNISTPIILMGEVEAEFKNSIVVKNKYDIKSLLQAMAKMLELTAKQMASREVPKYFPVPIRLLQKMSKTHCELYSRESKDDFDFSYTKILEKDTPFGGLIKNYIDENVEHLFIDASERLKFINKVSGFIINEFSKSDLTLDETIEITAQGQSMVAEEIFENQEISDAVAEVSKSCVRAMVKVVKEVPKLRNLLSMLLENKSNFVFKHGIVASYIANQIIENISWGSKEQMEKVTFSLFFHDLFLVPIFAKYPEVECEEDLLFHEGVSDEEKEIVLNHAKLAGSVVQTFPKAPMGADMIIIQHHGMTSGRGFGINFKDDISPLAKIIVIAEDVATGILIDISDGKKKGSLDIKRIIKRLNDRYTYNSYKKIILTLENLKV